VLVLLLLSPAHARDATPLEPVDEIKNIITSSDPEFQETVTTMTSTSTLASGEETEDITVEINPSNESYKTLKREKRMLFGLHWVVKAPFLVAHHFVKKVVGFSKGFVQGITPIFG